jgi:hypothetical protein
VKVCAIGLSVWYLGSSALTFPNYLA